MKKTVLIILIILVWNTNQSQACSCGGSTKFSNFLGGYATLVHGKVISHHSASDLFANYLLLEVIKVYYGKEKADTIKVWGDNGTGCTPHSRNFSVGTEWLFALNRFGGTYHFYSCADGEREVKNNTFQMEKKTCLLKNIPEMGAENQRNNKRAANDELRIIKKADSDRLLIAKIGHFRRDEIEAFPVFKKIIEDKKRSSAVRKEAFNSGLRYIQDTAVAAFAIKHLNDEFAHEAYCVLWEHGTLEVQELLQTAFLRNTIQAHRKNLVHALLATPYPQNSDFLAKNGTPEDLEREDIRDSFTRLMISTKNRNAIPLLKPYALKKMTPFLKKYFEVCPDAEVLIDNTKN
jgi:hypothetical protein